MQHVYALTFASLVTGLMAAFILYYDYGFWRDTYSRNEVVVSEQAGDGASKEATVETLSPKDMLGSFLEEAGARYRALATSSKDLLNGKEEYGR